MGPPAAAPSPAPGFAPAAPSASPRSGPGRASSPDVRGPAGVCSFSSRGFQHRSFPRLGREAGLIFDCEDGCWLPAGLDSDTFPVLADRPLVGGAVPFGRHVSRRAGEGCECGPRGAAGAGRGDGSRLAGLFCPWGWGAIRAGIWRGRAGGARRSPPECAPNRRLGRLGGAGLSRETSADDSRRPSPSPKGFLRLTEFSCTGGKKVSSQISAVLKSSAGKKKKKKKLCLLGCFTNR